MALEDDRGRLRQNLEEPLRAAAAEAEQAEQPAELEDLGATLIPSLAVVTAPEAVSDIVEMLEEIEARALLRALAAAAPPPVAQQASEAAARLGEAPGSPAADGVGRLVPERAWRLDYGEPVTSVLVECRRPGFKGSELFGFTIEHEETDGALKDGFMTGQLPEGGIDGRVAALPVEPEALRPDAAVEELAAAARRGNEIDVGPLPDAVGPLTVLLRAAGVRDAEAVVEPLPVLSMLTPFVDPAEVPDQLEELDEEELRAQIDALLEEFEAWQGEGDGRARELAVYIAGVMFDYRAGYIGGDLAGWTEWELDEFLLDYVPRKVGLEDEDIDAVPATVCQVLRFLGESGRLDGGTAARLGARALRLQDEFCEAARDPERFGMAKGMSAAMEADGVDLFDQDAIQGWINDFNSLTIAEREERVPVLATLPGPKPAPKKPRSAAAKAKKRQRQARRRNRR